MYVNAFTCSLEKEVPQRWIMLHGRRLNDCLESTLSRQMLGKTAVLSLGGSFQGGREENIIPMAYPDCPIRLTCGKC